MANILFIDQDRPLVKLYSAVLKRAGHEVVHCSEVQRAVELADKFVPDLIIMELHLQGHNGVEFLYEFRSYPDWQTVPIVVVSNIPFTALVVSELVWEQLGVAAYHYKAQLSLQQLLGTINRVLVPQSS